MRGGIFARRPNPSGLGNPGQPRSTALRGLRLAFLLGVLAVAAWLVATRWATVAALLSGARVGVLAAALLLASVQFALMVSFWWVALRAVGSPVPYRTVLRATATALAGRYVPGGIWYPLGRAALLAREGVRATSLAVVTALEMAFGVAIAGSAGLALLGAAGRLPGGGLWLAVAAVLLGLACSPPSVNAVLRLVARQRGEPEPVRLRSRPFAAAVALLVAYWLCAATTFTVYVHAFPAAAGAGAAAVAGAFLVAWVVGFLALVAPQGVGVFEVTAASILAVDGVAEVALVLAGFRALIALRDAVLFAAASLWGRRRRSPS